MAHQNTGKTITSIWLPHGNSDKGHTSLHMEGLKHDTHALLYGERMVEFLKLKGSFAQLKKVVRVGNFRKTYFLKHRHFYEELLPAHPFILYAPTWKDQEGGSSAHAVLPFLLENIPEPYTLVIKPHPNLTDGVVEKLLLRAEITPSVYVLHSFPPVYPLLDKMAFYIGDTSSIGYDALFFNKPLFFIAPPGKDLSHPSFHLFRAGHVLTPSDYPLLYTKLVKEMPYEGIAFRENLYLQTYGPDKPWEQIYAEIKEAFLES